MLEPLQQMHGDAWFWTQTLDGLVVLASPTRFDVMKLPRAVPELAIVADNFHIKPLLRYAQSADRYQVLAIAEDKLALYEGYRHALDPIALPKVSGAIRTPASSDPRAEVVPGQGIEGCFRMVDQAVTDQVSKPSWLPLILAGLAENLAPFRAAFKKPFLMADAISGIDPFALETNALRDRAWAVMLPNLLTRLSKLSEDFGTAVSRQQGTGDLSDAAQAAVASRIKTLLIDADQIQPGSIDMVTVAIRSEELGDPKIDDKLDDLAELVMKTGGEVIVGPSERMPIKTGLAAIFRY